MVPFGSSQTDASLSALCSCQSGLSLPARNSLRSEVSLLAVGLGRLGSVALVPDTATAGVVSLLHSVSCLGIFLSTPGFAWTEALAAILDSASYGSLLSVRSSVQVASAPLVFGAGCVGLPPSALDSGSSEALSMVQSLLWMESSPLAMGFANTGPFLSALGACLLGPPPPLKSRSRIDASLLLVEHTLPGSSLLLQSFTWAGPLLSVFGLSCGALLLASDLLCSGLPLLLRGSGCMDSAMLTWGVARSGIPVAVLELSTCGSVLAIRNSGRLGLSLLLAGNAKPELPMFPVDVAFADALLLPQSHSRVGIVLLLLDLASAEPSLMLRSHCRPGSVVLASGSMRSDPASVVPGLCGLGSLSLLQSFACLDFILSPLDHADSELPLPVKSCGCTGSLMSLCGSLCSGPSLLLLDSLEPELATFIQSPSQADVVLFALDFVDFDASLLLQSPCRLGLVASIVDLSFAGSTLLLQCFA